MLNPTFLQLLPAWVATLMFFLLVIIFYLAGHFIRARRNRRIPELSHSDSEKMSTLLIGLLSFLLAFTFSMANSRYEKRRDLIIEEANDISTAILRVKAYPDSMRQLITPVFKEYVEERITFSTVGMDLQALEYHFLKADSIGKKLWAVSVSYITVNPYRTSASGLLPALNAMIDITTTRRSAGESTIPDSIMYFLFILGFSASFLLGYENKSYTDWFILFVFAIMISVTIFTIIDLDRPRSGLIHFEVAVQKLIELRDMFK
jgi:hypothetical protein